MRADASLFGPRFRAAREALGVSASEVAKRAGLTQAAVSQIEGGKRMPSLQSAIALAGAIGARLSKLLGET